MMVETVLVSIAAGVAILAGIFGAVRISAHWAVASVKEIVEEELKPIKAKLVTEFSGNGGGSREALNELHVKVDAGFAEAARERSVLAQGQRDITDRINTLEAQRARRQHDDPNQ